MYSTGSSSRRNGTQWHLEGAHRQQHPCPYTIPAPLRALANTIARGHCSSQPDQLDAHISLFPCSCRTTPRGPQSLIRNLPSKAYTQLRTHLSSYTKENLQTMKAEIYPPSITTTELKAQLKTSLKLALNPNTLHKHQAQHPAEQLCGAEAAAPAPVRPSSPTDQLCTDTEQPPGPQPQTDPPESSTRL